MLLRIDPLAPQPVFEQLAYQVKAAVARGELESGDRLPSVREMAAELRVNPNTVVRALELLEREGVIVRRQGAGCFVTPPSTDRTARARRAELDRLVEKAVTESYHLGFGAAAVRDAVEAALRRVRFPGEGGAGRAEKRRSS